MPRGVKRELGFQVIKQIPAHWTFGDEPVIDFETFGTDDRIDLERHGIHGIEWATLVMFDHSSWCEVAVEKTFAKRIALWEFDIAYPGWKSVGDVPSMARTHPTELNEGRRVLWHRTPGNIWCGLDPRDIQNQIEYLELEKENADGSIQDGEQGSTPTSGQVAPGEADDDGA